VQPPSAPPPADTAGEQSLRSVLAALAANTAITIAKAVAALMTGSAALLAETLHSAADAGNELFLLVALRRSAREPDARHPFGYGAERYFWALLAALGMFVIGGVVSVWHGVQDLLEPMPIDAFWVGVVVLVIALTLDSWSRFVASREVGRRARARGQSVRDYVRESADPTLTTVYLEDTADVLGAALALAALILHETTGFERADALASVAIGLLLLYIATRLAARNRDLLTNQAVPERYTEHVRREIEADDAVDQVRSLEAIYLGPRDVLVTGEVKLADAVDGHGGIEALDRLREELSERYPQVRRWYLTPVP
jgi:cation diffusion facilitator family transporter